MSWAAGRAIESTRGVGSATASPGPDTQRRHTVACICSEQGHPAARPQALSVQVMIAGLGCARVFPALPAEHVRLLQCVAGFHRVDGAADDLPA